MHLLMIVIALSLAWSIRLIQIETSSSWQQRWQKTLFIFLFPPLLLLMTALAVLSMGPVGEMLGLQASWFSYLLPLGWLGLAIIFLIKLAYQGWLSCQQITKYSQQLVKGKTAKIINTNFPYSAQIGFWQPQLVITQGLLTSLDDTQIEAVLAHEQAHADNHDTFWFFWWGWLKACTAWLPNTESLWQELLLLREMRADYQAATQTDSLVLAESLLVVAQKVNEWNNQSLFSEELCAALANNRLEERIEALLTTRESYQSENRWISYGIILALLPLITLPLHY